MLRARLDSSRCIMARVKVLLLLMASHVCSLYNHSFRIRFDYGSLGIHVEAPSESASHARPASSSGPSQPPLPPLLRRSFLMSSCLYLITNPLTIVFSIHEPRRCFHRAPPFLRQHVHLLPPVGPAQPQTPALCLFALCIAFFELECAR